MFDLNAPKKKRRRRPTLQERLTPCACCRYPLSQRHHLLEVARHGENPATVQLCANCHEVYHLIAETRIRKMGQAQININNALVHHVMSIYPERVFWLRDLVERARVTELDTEEAKTA